MDYSNNFLSCCQYLKTFETLEACKAYVGGQPDAAQTLFEFAAFLRAGAPLFCQIWGEDFITSAPAYRFAAVFPDGNKISVNPLSHSLKQWQQGAGLTAAEVINALRSRDNYYTTPKAPDKKRYVNLINLMSPSVCCIDVDYHNPNQRDQRPDFLAYLARKKINCFGEPTTAGLHFYFPSDGTITQYVSGPAAATDATGAPFDVEILANEFSSGKAVFSNARACFLGVGRVPSYVQQLQTLKQTMISSVFLPIPRGLIPTRDTSKDNARIDLPPSMQTPPPAPVPPPAMPQPSYQQLYPYQQPPAVPAAAPRDYRQLQASYVQPPAAVQTPPAVPAVSAPPSPVMPAPAPAEQTAGDMIPPPETWQPGTRNKTMYKYLCRLAVSIRPGDHAAAILRCCALEAYSRIPNKTDFGLPEVNTIAASAVKTIKEAEDNADPDRKLKALCRRPRQAVEWALDQLQAAIIYDEMLKRVHCSAKTLRLLCTDVYNVCRRHLRRDEIQEEMIAIAEAHKAHPVRTWLESLAENRQDAELRKLFDVLQIAQKPPIYMHMVKAWLRQCVCCLYNGTGSPAVCFPCENVLVLQGRQGAGKTSLIRHLATRQEWFLGGAKYNKDKDNERRILTHWIAELGEIGSTMKGDQDALKAFISREYDQYRVPFGREDTEAPRQTSLCGTTNPKEFLCDSTGARRFWIVPTPERMNRAKILSIDTAALWAYIFTEVKDAVAAGAQYGDLFRLDPEDYAAAAQLAEGYQKKTQIETDLENILYSGYVDETALNWRNSTQLAAELPWSQRVTSNALSRELNRLGYPSRIARGRQKLYGVAVTQETADTIARYTNGAVRYIAVPDNPERG